MKVVLMPFFRCVVAILLTLTLGIGYMSYQLFEFLGILFWEFKVPKRHWEYVNDRMDLLDSPYITRNMFYGGSIYYKTIFHFIWGIPKN